jgi:branched-chain amino acid transport system permease protein
MILATMLGGIGTIWGPVLGAFILIPASDFILFRFGSTTIHLAIFGISMMLIILFLPKGILPTVKAWLEERRAPRAAHQGARTMAEMQDSQVVEEGNQPIKESIS